MRQFDVEEAISCLAAGGVLAYPTEAMYGLGCDPFNESAVKRILELKQRSSDKGLILLVKDEAQLYPLIDMSSLSSSHLEAVYATWPGPVTWLFPRSSRVPAWVSGRHATVAIRMSAHPVAQALCANGPVVSTSANVEGALPARDEAMLVNYFSHHIDGMVKGDLGTATAPSRIIDVRSSVQLR